MTRQVNIGGVTVGDGRAIVVAGPCAVEPAYVVLAGATAKAGADVLRGFIFKHRTSPRSFQGLGLDGLGLVEEAKRATGLPVAIEAVAAADIGPLLDVADALQVGSRNMQNVELLRAVGRSRLPVILKRGMSASYEEWLGAAEYIEEAGGREIILCERGIRTFVTGTRNTLDIAAVAYLRTVCDHPVMVDPSHAAGRRDLVPALAEAALAIGADGLEVEAHLDPPNAMSDPEQAVTMDALRGICERRDWYATANRSRQEAAVAVGV